MLLKIQSHFLPHNGNFLAAFLVRRQLQAFDKLLHWCSPEAHTAFTSLIDLPFRPSSQCSWSGVGDFDVPHALNWVCLILMWQIIPDLAWSWACCRMPKAPTITCVHHNVAAWPRSRIIIEWPGLAHISQRFGQVLQKSRTLPQMELHKRQTEERTISSLTEDNHASIWQIWKGQEVEACGWISKRYL